MKLLLLTLILGAIPATTAQDPLVAQTLEKHYLVNLGGRKITGRENNGAYRIAPIKEYRQDKYLFRYDAAKHAYHMPDDYPLNIQY